MRKLLAILHPLFHLENRQELLMEPLNKHLLLKSTKRSEQRERVLGKLQHRHVKNPFSLLKLGRQNDVRSQHVHFGENISIFF